MHRGRREPPRPPGSKIFTDMSPLSCMGRGSFSGMLSLYHFASLGQAMPEPKLRQQSRLPWPPTRNPALPGLWPESWLRTSTSQVGRAGSRRQGGPWAGLAGDPFILGVHKHGLRQARGREELSASTNGLRGCKLRAGGAPSVDEPHHPVSPESAVSELIQRKGGQGRGG